MMKENGRSQATRCRLTLDYLLTYLENPDTNRAALDAAIDHMKECPACASRVGRLVQALTTDEEDQLTCQECQDLLPGYVRAEADGQARESQWHPVVLHLQTCPHCSEAHVALSDLMALADGEAGREPPEYPVPELSFLRERDESPHPLRIPWYVNELGAMVIEFSTELVRVLQTPPYRPTYAPGLKTAGEQRVLCQLSLKKAVQDLEVTVTVEEEPSAPARCTVIVEVNIPSKGGWPNLAGSKVALKRGQEPLETQWTDAFGKAVFEGVRTEELPQLVFEITPAEGSARRE
jgi:hypothetical protein